MAGLLDDLKSEIAKRQVVVVVGAGVSMAATRGNPLASWPGLLLSGVERCVERSQPLPAGWEDRRRAEIASQDLGEFLLTAEAVSWRLGAPRRGEYASWLRETVGSLEVKDASVIDALRDLDVILATTNYDGLLDDPRELPAVTWRQGPEVTRVVRRDDRAVLHLHGHWKDPESVVLGIRSYEQVLGDAHAQALLQALRMTRTFLFVGCGDGLADPNFGKLREWSRGLLKDDGYRHFRLCRESELDSLRKMHSPEERIFPLSYGAEFSDLAGFLRGLRSSGRRSRQQLPPPPICFGREKEICDLVDSICSESPPPVPVLGQAGIGKSTVVIKALHDSRVRDRYGEHRFAVRCDGATDRESLVGEIARSLDVEAGPRREDRLFGKLDQGALVLALNDAEKPYWTETTAVEDLLARLAAVPGLALVISLRGEERPLGTGWRDAIRLRPLLPEPAKVAFLAVAGQRFRDDPHLEQLLAAVDGWPLALTLLAHRAELEPDLSSLWGLWKAKRIELLRSDSKDGLNIDVSLKVSIDSPRMTEDSRRLLSLLSVLPEGIGRPQLEAFFPEAQSAAASLLRVGLAQNEGERVRALAPVRGYVRVRHPVTREDLQRAVKHYLRWAQEIQQSLESSALELTQHTAQEFGNLEELVFASLTPPVAADADSADDTSENIRSILSLGSLLSSTGLSQRASAIVGKALQRAQDIGDPRLQIDCLILLGDIARVQDNLEEARRCFMAGVELSRQIDNSFLTADGISKLGAVEQGYSNLDLAAQSYKEAAGLFADLGADAEQGRCLLGLARIHLDRRELVDAEAKGLEAMDFLSRAESEPVRALGRANCLNFLGEVALETKNLILAKERVEAAQAIYKELASPLGKANTLKNLAKVALLSGDPPTASALFSEALDLFKLIGHRHGEADSLQGLGDLAGDPETARARYREALSIYERIGDPFLIGHEHLRLSRVAAQENERREHLEAARTAWIRIGRLDLVEELLQEPG